MKSASREINEIPTGDPAKMQGGMLSAGKLVEGSVAEIRRILDRREMGSGFAELDALTGGFRSGELTVLAAPPASGKSVLAMRIAEAVLFAKGGNGAVSFFAPGMDSQKLLTRMICARAGVGDKVPSPRKSAEDGEMLRRIEVAAGEFARAVFYIDGSEPLSVSELREKVLLLGGVDFVIVDDFQKLKASDPFMSRKQMVAEIADGLKSLSLELAVPVLAVSRLSVRQDLHTANLVLGKLVELADVVMFLATVSGNTRLHVAKNKRGRIGFVTLGR